MVSEEEIKDQFSDLGIDISREVLSCCVELCERHCIDERVFVETWVAHSLTNLDGAAPTIDTLTIMVKKEFKKDSRTSITNGSNTPVIYKSSPQSKTKDTQLKKELNTTPKGRPRLSQSENDSQGNFSPASFSPHISTSSTKYSSRPNSGQTVASYGKSESGWKGKAELNPLTVDHYLEKKMDQWQCLDETLLNAAALHWEAKEGVAEYLIEKYQLTLTNDDTFPREVSTFVGIVACDEPKLTCTNIHINCIFSDIKRLALDLSGVSEFGLFPGQVVAVQGVLVNGIKLVVKHLYTSGVLPQIQEAPRISEPLQILVCAGPFTQIDTLAYDPLNDLMEFIKNNQPNLVFLIGPLIDANHTHIKNGEVAELFIDFYKRLLSTISTAVEGSFTQVYYVASGKDAFNIPVYPTCPIPIDENSRVRLLPDPDLISINGLVMGITATDILFDIGKQEVAQGSNRLARLAGHILQQQSFYPLHPPDPDIGMDVDLWRKHASLPVTPHLMILPSDLHYFIKVVEGCVVVNPERLAKGITGGSFSCIEVRPKKGEEEWTASTHISAKVLKI